MKVLSRIIALFGACSVFVLASASEAPSAWEYLPAGTHGAVAMPTPSEAIAHLEASPWGQRAAFGSFFDEIVQRPELIPDGPEDGSVEAWLQDTFQLDSASILAAFAGDCGIAGTLVSDGPESYRYQTYAWLTPAEHARDVLAERLDYYWTRLPQVDAQYLEEIAGSDVHIGPLLDADAPQPLYLATAWQGERLLAVFSDDMANLESAIGRWLTNLQADVRPCAERVRADPLFPLLPGVTIMRGFVDNTDLLSVLTAGMGPMGAERIEQFGFSQLGMGHLHYVVDDRRVISRAAVALPAPRQGLAALLDQPHRPLEIPTWVPADVVNYAHLMLDVPAIYQAIVEVMRATLGPMAEGQLDMANESFAGMTGVSLDRFLAAFGDRFLVVDLPFAETGEALEMELEEAMLAVQPPQAMVLTLQDGELVEQALRQLFLAEIPQAERREEQGFSTWTFGPMSVHIGQGYLILGTGADAGQRIAASIRQPLPETEQLRHAGRVAALFSEQEQRECLIYGIGWLDRIVKRVEVQMKRMAPLAEQMDSDLGAGEASVMTYVDIVGELLGAMQGDGAGDQGLQIQTMWSDGDGLHLEGRQSLD